MIVGFQESPDSVSLGEESQASLLFLNEELDRLEQLHIRFHMSGSYDFYAHSLFLDADRETVYLVPTRVNSAVPLGGYSQMSVWHLEYLESGYA